MFEQTSRLAEKLAASLSRRAFLGSLGRWAGTAALGVAGGLSTLTGGAQARGNILYLCVYGNKGRCFFGCQVNPLQICGGKCPTFDCCRVASKTIIGTC
jgi:hypothetical protein